METDAETDENLYNNPMLLTLISKYPVIYKNLLENEWILCVPSAKSIESCSLSFHAAAASTVSSNATPSQLSLSHRASKALNSRPFSPSWELEFIDEKFIGCHILRPAVPSTRSERPSKQHALKASASLTELSSSHGENHPPAVIPTSRSISILDTFQDERPVSTESPRSPQQLSPERGDLAMTLSGHLVYVSNSCIQLGDGFDN